MNEAIKIYCKRLKMKIMYTKSYCFVGLKFLIFCDCSTLIKKRIQLLTIEKSITSLVPQSEGCEDGSEPVPVFYKIYYYRYNYRFTMYDRDSRDENQKVLNASLITMNTRPVFHANCRRRLDITLNTILLIPLNRFTSVTP